MKTREFERGLIRERTNEGLAAAKARGRAGRWATKKAQDQRESSTGSADVC